MVIIVKIKNWFLRLQAWWYTRDFLSYLVEQNIIVTAAYLFGSRAAGTSGKWSDVDICVVSTSFGKQDPLSFLLHTLRRKDIIRGIEPHGFTPEEFSDENDPLVHEIKKTGIRIV